MTSSPSDEEDNIAALCNFDFCLRNVNPLSEASFKRVKSGSDLKFRYTNLLIIQYFIYEINETRKTIFSSASGNLMNNSQKREIRLQQPVIRTGIAIRSYPSMK